MRRVKNLVKRLFFISNLKSLKKQKRGLNTFPKIFSSKRSDRRAAVRKKEIKLRKNFLPTLLVIVLLWSFVFFEVYFVNPEKTSALPLFFFLLFLALLFTFSTIFANTRRGMIISLLTIIFLVLRYLGVGNVLNLLLISGLGISAEVYFSKK